jgi:hypothetical protein
MRRLLFVIVLIGACVVALGFYQGWFRIRSDNTDGKSNVTLSMDKDKIKEDEKKAQEKVEDVGNKIKGKIAGPDEKSMDGTVVSISGDKLTMTNKEGIEHSHVLKADIKVTCDSKVCKAADLKPGMRVRVTENAESHAATRIEALDTNRDFEKGA